MTTNFFYKRICFIIYFIRLFIHSIHSFLESTKSTNKRKEENEEENETISIVLDIQDIQDTPNYKSKYKSFICHFCFRKISKKVNKDLYFAMDKSFCTDVCREKYIYKVPR